MAAIRCAGGAERRPSCGGTSSPGTRNRSPPICAPTEGQDLVRWLIGEADILIENFKPGTLERWNLSPDDLCRSNPGLIVVRVSGYGQTGPYAARAGFGGIGEAVGGWRHVVGDADRPPARMGISIGDTLAATYGCMGALAALHERGRSGRGQIVDSAIYESVLQVMESLVPEYAVEGHVRERSGSILPGIAPSNVYSLPRRGLSDRGQWRCDLRAACPGYGARGAERRSALRHA